MSWERFGYICRRAKNELGQSQSVDACLTAIDKSPGADIYGKSLSGGAMATKLVERMGELKSKEDAILCSQLYSQLNLSNHIEEPMYFKRVLAYLAYIAVVFYVLVAVYQVKVVPQFVAALQSLGQSTPESLMWFQSYWVSLLLLVTVLISAALFIGFELKGLFKFEGAPQNGFVYRYLAGASIRRSYQAIIDIIQFPLINSVSEERSSSSAVIRHLNDVAETDMCLASEMASLLRVSMRDLLNACEKRLKIITTIVALTVVATIFIFLVSAYSPLFILGNAL